jgi:hypothetical protein
MKNFCGFLGFGLESFWDVFDMRGLVWILNFSVTWDHRQRWKKRMHVVYEIFPHLIMKFLGVFCSFLCISLNVLVSFYLYKIVSVEIKKAHQHIQTYTQKRAKYKRKSFTHHMYYLYTFFIHAERKVPVILLNWVQKVSFVPRKSCIIQCRTAKCLHVSTNYHSYFHD